MVGIIDVFKTPAGVYLVAAIFFSIGLQSFIVNVSLKTSIHFTRGIIVLSNVFLLSVWLTALMGIIKKNVFALILALILWSVYICLWVGAVIFSMFALGEMCMCSYGRCPESMWLFNNSWHNNTSLELKRDYELDEDYKIKPIENNHSTERVHFTDRKSIKSDVVSTSDKSFVNDDNALDSQTLKPRSFGVPDMAETYDNDFYVLSSKLEQQVHFKNPWSLVVLIVMICVVFGVMIFGWYVLFTILLELKRKIKLCPPVESDLTNATQTEFTKYCPKREVCPNHTQ